jgi:hypothetical protein
MFYWRLLDAGVDTIVHEPSGSIRLSDSGPPPVPPTIALGRGAGLLLPEIGWSYPEQDGPESWVWTLDRRAVLRIPFDGTPRSKLTLRVRVLNRDTEVELWWNGRSLGAHTAGSSPRVVMFDLPPEATRAGWTEFELRGPAPVHPRGSADPRRLGVCVYEIAVQ